jgi:hypothetical protein
MRPTLCDTRHTHPNHHRHRLALAPARLPVPQCTTDTCKYCTTDTICGTWCLDGYYRFNNQVCLACAEGCSSCTPRSACTACNKGYVKRPNDTTCTRCPASCATCDYAPSGALKCTSCPPRQLLVVPTGLCTGNGTCEHERGVWFDTPNQQAHMCCVTALRQLAACLPACLQQASTTVACR